MSEWRDYEEIVQMWEHNIASAKQEWGSKSQVVRDMYRERYEARMRHPSWDQRRQAFLFYTDETCEHCGGHFAPADLQLHHLHYDTLWYERNKDLELLCAPCHRKADEKRARQQRQKRTAGLSREARARIYMETANRWSGQSDWPVSYSEAYDIVG